MPKTIRFGMLCIYSCMGFTLFAQNVGIGVTNPQQRLHVNGTIRSTTLAAPAGTNTLVQTNINGDILQGPRFLHGNVNSDGTVAGGSSGFTVTKGAAGLYTINFSTPFTSVPTVVATPLQFTTASPPCANTPPATCAATHTSGCGVGDLIQNFSTTGGITNITNLASGCSAGNYGNFTAQVVTVPFSGAFNFTVQAGPLYSQSFGIWIDSNQDGNFSVTENVYISPGASTAPFAGSINTTGIPCGTYRMRVRCAYFGTITAAEGCGLVTTSIYGETEDYTLVINGGPITTRHLTNLANVSGTSADVVITLPNGSTLLDAPFHFQVLGQ
jgi:hypothetical protein